MIIVTGGAGFIGSAIVAALNQRGESDIIIVDELGTSEKWKNLRALDFTDYMEKEDFHDMLVDNDLPLGTEAVIHMGACTDTTENDMAYLIRNNFEFSKFLALEAQEAEVRFIYASSAATYGDGTEGFVDNEQQIHRLRRRRDERGARSTGRNGVWRSGRRHSSGRLHRRGARPARGLDPLRLPTGRRMLGTGPDRATSQQAGPAMA